MALMLALDFGARPEAIDPRPSVAPRPGFRAPLRCNSTLRLVRQGASIFAAAATVVRVRCRRVARQSLRQLPDVDVSLPAAASPFRFSSQANWLAPGHVLVGRYPLTAPDEAEGRAHLRRLLEAGVTTFVCLQSEVPPQTERQKWPTEGIKLNGRRCLLYAQLALQFAGGRKLHFLHEPMDDLSSPGLKELHRLVADLETRIRSGETVFLHCWGGRGRSATVAGCLLMRLYNLTPEEVLQRVQYGYDSRDYDNSVSPETAQQRRTVHDFYSSSAAELRD